MTIGAIVLFLVVTGMILSLDRALHGRLRSRRLALTSAHVVPFEPENVVPIRRAVPPAVRESMRWISMAEFEQIHSSDPETLVFRLVDSAQSCEEATAQRGELAVTLDHVMDLIHWLPRQSRMVFYRTEGWTPQLVDQLRQVTQGRRILLLRSSTGLSLVTRDAVPGTATSGEEQCS